MQRWKRDVIYSIAILVFCAVHWLIAGTFVQNVIKLPIAMPSTYAYLWLGILGALALAQLVRAVVTRPSEELEVIWKPLPLITMISLGIYATIVQTVGFLLSTMGLMIVLIISFSIGAGKIDTNDRTKMIKSCVLYGILGIFIAIAVQFIFGELLGAKLP